MTTPIYTGTMGWSYADWQGVFYPPGTASKDYLPLYARAFNVVEIDSTFYGTPRETQVETWRKTTPATFVFCPKVPRLITHDLHLVGAEAEMERFLGVIECLEEKLGPILLQMGPDFTRAHLPALEQFLPRLQEWSAPTTRFAVEFRHRSLIGPDVSALLAENGIALACADYAPMPRRFECTASFLYLRLIGRHGAYTHHRASQADRTADMQRWANAIQENQANLTEVYAFCNNDYEGYSPTSVNRFRSLLGLTAATSPQEVQGSLF